MRHYPYKQEIQLSRSLISSTTERTKATRPQAIIVFDAGISDAAMTVNQ